MKQFNLRSLCTALVLLIAAPQAASALTTYEDPNGNLASNVRIGYVSPWGQYIAWERGGTCSWVKIGDAGGLYDDVWVRARGGADTIHVQSSGSASFCGYTFTALVYNGFYLDVFGDDGNDQLSGAAGNTFFFGGGGNDSLNLYNPVGVQRGDTGDDTIWATSTGTGERLWGDDGDDCVWDQNASYTTLDCGAGSGDGSYPVLGTGCESVDVYCSFY